MEEKELVRVELIPFDNFKEKITITKEYDRRSTMEIIDNKFVYVEIISGDVYG